MLNIAQAWGKDQISRAKELDQNPSFFFFINLKVIIQRFDL